MKYRGSVLPRAVKYAIPSVLMTAFLKILEVTDVIELEVEDVIKNGTAFSGFSFVLGFALVFRTSQAYSRFWAAATSMQSMRAEWFEACSMCMVFSRITKTMTRAQAVKFEHTLARLFSLLHAMALETLGSVANENFPVLDITAFPKEHLLALRATDESERVEMALTWVQHFVFARLQDGSLGVPPPICTRVFGELRGGIVNFNEALQVMKMPFPFPYAQMTTILLVIYMAFAPLVVALWVRNLWLACMTTLVLVVCMLSINCIAVEIEDPFGADANDIPGLELQMEMNEDLLMLLSEDTWVIPVMRDSAITDARELRRMNDEGAFISLNTWCDSAGVPPIEPKVQEPVPREQDGSPDAAVQSQTVPWAEQKAPAPAPATAPEPPWQELLSHLRGQSEQLQRHEQIHSGMLETLQRCVDRLGGQERLGFENKGESMPSFRGPGSGGKEAIGSSHSRAVAQGVSRLASQGGSGRGGPKALSCCSTAG